MKTPSLTIMLVATLISAQAQTLDQVQASIENVRTSLAPDKRQTVYEINAGEFADGTVYVDGKISDRNIYESLGKELNTLGSKLVNHIELLPDTLWGIVRVPVGCMRTKGSYSGELATQALMGMPLRLLEKEGGWWRVQSPDGYIGWMYGSGFVRKTPEQMQQWRASDDRFVVTSLHQIYGYDSPKDSSPRNIVTDLLPGNIVEGKLASRKNGKTEVSLPDGRKCWVEAKYLTPVTVWASQMFDADVILNQAYAMMGAPYLWGGTSAKSTDCSGLVKISYLANGLILRRDASQQALIGHRMSPEELDGFEAADLLFFGEEPGGRVTHVALYDKDKKFIHCAGRVHQSEMTSDDATWGNRQYMGATRIKGCEGTVGITRAIDHPWYFNNK